MRCEFFAQQRCASCKNSDIPYSLQVEQKDARLRAMFAPFSPKQWLTPVLSHKTQFRNKAKMVALGAAHQPTLGIENVQDGSPLSLVNCPLYPDETQQFLSYLQDWIRVAGIPPYNKVKKKGELKFVLLTRAQNSGEFMLRFVMRSDSALERVRVNLPRLQQAFPNVTVVTVNIQPVHMARLEGEEEIFLTQQQSLLERLNHVPLVIRPKSFFQTNPQVAEKLYATAQQWVAEIRPKTMWDLFCGVGGFGLHCASEHTSVTGIEIEAEAIASAKRSAAMMGIENLDFAALDSGSFSQSQEKMPELILVNPPRRGLGASLAEQLELSGPKYVIYSSCNPETMAKDLLVMSNYKILRCQWFDMFPHTDHTEAMMLLERS
ncbi:23S rRNA (uracil(747)-C(5))-methyltransferase RlmC [Vibrio sp. PNB22_3_1]